MRILVLDNEPVSRKKMQKIMKNFGGCDAVAEGAQALAAFEEAWEDLMPYDLIMLDIVIPEMDGWQVLAEIRKREDKMGLSPTARVKTIMVTGKSDAESVLSSLKVGCDDYIVKPFDIITVKRKIAELF